MDMQRLESLRASLAEQLQAALHHQLQEDDIEIVSQVKSS